MKKIILYICLLFSQLNGKEGIIVALCDRYMGDFYPSLAWLRFYLKCDLPIEVWHSGDELSEKAKKSLEKFQPISFHDIAKVRNENPKEFRGYQIKPLILEATSFDQVLLIDADIYLFTNPRLLFELPEYQKTGAFFFRDTNNKQYGSMNDHGRHFYRYTKYESRKEFLLKLIKEPSESMPLDWRYFWEDFTPSRNNPQIAEFMESGIVVIDKRRHQKGVKEIVKLNLKWREVYPIFLGDKDTFWMGMEMAKEPYAVNRKIPYYLMGGMKLFRKSNKRVDLVHHVDGKLIFQQKTPIEIGLNPYYCWPIAKEDAIEIPEEELMLFQTLRHFYEVFSYPFQEESEGAISMNSNMK